MKISRQGFTFAELLVTTLLFTFIVAGFYSVLGVGRTTYFMDSNYLDLQQSNRNGMDRLVREVRQARTSGVSFTTLAANSEKVTFSTPSKSGIAYYRSGTNLIREYPSGTTQVVATNINYLDFELSGSLLKIDMRAEKIFFRTLSFPLVEYVRLRNG